MNVIKINLIALFFTLISSTYIYGGDVGFSAKEDRKWCGGAGGVLKSFQYHESQRALDECKKMKECGAVNCPKYFNKCELLRPLHPNNPCNGSPGDFLWRKQKIVKKEKKESFEKKLAEKFGPKEDRKWCGGAGGVLKTYSYNQSMKALEKCMEMNECGAVNCPKNFNKCELLRPLPRNNPCNGSSGDFLWRKK